MNDEYNDAIGEYEANLRDAERALEKAMQAICDLTGEDISEARYNVTYDILPKVQDAIRSTYKLYV